MIFIKHISQTVSYKLQSKYEIKVFLLHKKKITYYQILISTEMEIFNKSVT